MKKLLITCLLIIPLTIFSRTIVAGKGQAVQSLKQAIMLAREGDTILLHKGVYKEGNNVISRTIVLIGIGNPVLDGEGKHEILTISGKNIVVKGITFLNAGYSSMNDFAAIKAIDASGTVISGNTITNSAFAIHISNSTGGLITKNIIRGTNLSEHSSGNGIHLWKCSGMNISDNQVSGHRDGIYLEFVTGSSIANNISERNIRYGLHFMFSHNDDYYHNTFRNNGAGVAVMYSKNVKMQRNIFDQNWGASAYGILLKDITDSQIGNNTFYRNTVGIHMEGSSRIIIQKNIFRENGWALKVQASCDDNIFHHNNFFGNSFDIATNGARALNKFHNNYWDKYEGYDLNRDGIGDVPYHPVSVYSMIVEQNPATLILMRSFMVSLMDKAEKAFPGLTPEDLVDSQPSLKPNKL